MEKGHFKVAIIGGGASGMMAAISAAMILPGSEIILLEKNQEVGKKLLATGNGRCNLSNRNCRYSDYGEGGSITVRQVLGKMNTDDAVAFFEEIGLLIREEDEGRLYPYPEQAVTVRDLLESELRHLKVTIDVGTAVTGIEIQEPENGCPVFSILFSDHDAITADAVIIATGGKAGGQYGSTGDGYGFAKSFGHTLIRPRPALVSLVAKNWNYSNLKGVRFKGTATLLSNGAIVSHKKGEIQFTEYGLSGICIFDLSRFFEAEQSNIEVRLDFFPHLSEEELLGKLNARVNAFSTRPPEAILEGMIHQKLIPVFSPLIAKVNLEKLVKELKGWNIPISATRGWNEAQVTAGGIDCAEIYRHTLGSNKIPGLYFAGEVIDVDGPCGGWNLQWAWSSGFVAGESAALWIINQSMEGDRRK